MAPSTSALFCLRSNKELAVLLSSSGTPGRAEVEKTRRKLEGLVASGLADKTEGTAGGAEGPGGPLHRQVGALEAAGLVQVPLSVSDGTVPDYVEPSKR
jgi:hypothetical protein